MPLKKTIQEFIDEGEERWPGKDDYSQVEYKNQSIEVTLICKECETHYQIKPKNYLAKGNKGSRCKQCSKKESHIRAIQKGNQLFRERIEDLELFKLYNYDKVEYQGGHKHVTIICRQCKSNHPDSPDEYEFQQSPVKHTGSKSGENPQGCPRCNAGGKGRQPSSCCARGHHLQLIEKKITSQFPNLTHDIDKNLNYLGPNTKFNLRCQEHDEIINTTPRNFEERKTHPCIKCQSLKEADVWKTEYNRIHVNKYTFPNLEQDFIDGKKKICISCPIHGEFEIPRNNKKTGCQVCSRNNQKDSCRKDVDMVIKDHKEKWSNEKYEGYEDWHNQYENRNSLLKLLCPKHGPFIISAQRIHKQPPPCGKCYRSYAGEENVRDILQKLGYPDNSQYQPEGLRLKNPLKIDNAILTEPNDIYIEFDGEQHLGMVNWGTSQRNQSFSDKLDRFYDSVSKDIVKNTYCKEKNIILVRIYHKDIDRTEELITKAIEYSRQGRIENIFSNPNDFNFLYILAKKEEVFKKYITSLHNYKEYLNTKIKKNY